MCRCALCHNCLGYQRTSHTRLPRQDRGVNYGRSYQLSAAGLALADHARVRAALAGAILIVLTVRMLSAAWGVQGRGGRAGQGRSWEGGVEKKRRKMIGGEWKVGERRREAEKETGERRGPVVQTGAPMRSHNRSPAQSESEVQAPSTIPPFLPV